MYFDEELAKLGCGDSGCMIQRPRGMATNGGCQCMKALRDCCRKDMETWRRFVMALSRYRQIVDVLARGKLIPEGEKGGEA